MGTIEISAAAVFGHYTRAWNGRLNMVAFERVAVDGDSINTFHYGQRFDA